MPNNITQDELETIARKLLLNPIDRTPQFSDVVKCVNTDSCIHTQLGDYYLVEDSTKHPDANHYMIEVKDSKGAVFIHRDTDFEIIGINFSFREYEILAQYPMLFFEEETGLPIVTINPKLVRTSLPVVFQKGDVVALTIDFPMLYLDKGTPFYVDEYIVSEDGASTVVCRANSKHQSPVPYKIQVNQVELIAINFTYSLFCFWQQNGLELDQVSLPEDRQIQGDINPIIPFQVEPSGVSFEIAEARGMIKTPPEIPDFLKPKAPKPYENIKVGDLVELTQDLGVVLLTGVQGIVTCVIDKDAVEVSFNDPQIPIDHRIKYSDAGETPNSGQWTVRSVKPVVYSICKKNLTVIKSGLTPAPFKQKISLDDKPKKIKRKGVDIKRIGRLAYIGKARRRPKGYKRLFWKFFWKTSGQANPKMKKIHSVLPDEEVNPDFYSEHGNATKEDVEFLVGFLDKHLRRLYSKKRKTKFNLTDKDRQEFDDVIDALTTLVLDKARIELQAKIGAYDTSAMAQDIKWNTKQLKDFVYKIHALEARIGELDESLVKMQSYYSWYEELDARLKSVENAITSSNLIPAEPQLQPNKPTANEEQHQFIQFIDYSNDKNVTMLMVGQVIDGVFHVQEMTEDPSAAEILLAKTKVEKLNRQAQQLN